MIKVAVLDMAGTTVRDETAVEAAFVAAVGEAGVEQDDPRLSWMRQALAAAAGRSKLVLFQQVFAGDDVAARKAHEAFEDRYAEHARSGDIVEIRGAGDALVALREAGVKIALTTALSATTQSAVIRALGWTEAADLVLSADEGLRGRPYPDLALTAAVRLRVDDVREVAVAGDTIADMTAGRRAGAAVVAGVLTGSQDAATLRKAGATHVLPSVAALPAILLD